MAIAAAVLCGSLALEKASLQPVSRQGLEGRQNKPSRGSLLQDSCKLGMEILEEILSNFSTPSLSTSVSEVQNSTLNS